MKKEEHKKHSEKERIEVSKQEIEEFSKKISEIKKEISRIIIGQEEIIEGLIRAILCNGHVILEGVPGIAKTAIIKSLGEVSGCEVKRVQFTADLLPTDILGLTIYKRENNFELVKGPIFANFIIADEINRAPPKTQSALLEAMQERQVTIGKDTIKLPKPFFVMATQNPIESSGVYNLPEAQMDRFIFKLIINYPKRNEEQLIMKQNLDIKKMEDFNLKKITSTAEIIKMQELVKKVYLSEKIEKYILDIVESTRDKNNKYAKYIDWGASPRGVIYIFIAAKAEALIRGRNFVIPEDIKKVALDILRHRIILNYEAQAENISSDYIIAKILDSIKSP